MRGLAAMLLAVALPVHAAPPSWDQAQPAQVPALHDALLAWRGDWSKLPLGHRAGKFKGDLGALKDVAGEDLQKTWTGPDEVVIRGLRARVHWKAPRGEKFRTTLFRVVGARRVVIEDVAIVAADADYRMYDTFHLEDVGEVIVRNVYFGGPVQAYHLRVFGARRVSVDGIEVEGLGPPGRRRAGGGVWIKNANQRHDKAPVDPNWVQAEWAQVQNGYFHDYEDADEQRNQDAINIESPGDGLIFNCVVDNWSDERGKVGDSAIDVSYRRPEAVGGKRLRIERNVFRKAPFTKTPGNGPPGNVVVWANNVYLDTHVGDYHGGWLNALVHNTFVLERAEHLYRMWKQKPEGRTLLAGNVVLGSRPLVSVIHFNDEGVRNKLALLGSDWNLFALPRPARWLGGKLEQAQDFEAWRALGFDAHSRLLEPVACPVGIEDMSARFPCRLPSFKLPEGYAPLRDLAVTRDFLGRTRPKSPSAGAFEPPAEAP